MQSGQMYRIINTTIKPPRRGRDGKDARTAVERVGHPVTFRNKDDRNVILMPKRSVITHHLDEGLLNLQRGGFVKISKIDDITTALEEHKLETTTAKKAAKKAAKKSSASKRNASAVQMGEDKHGSDKKTDSEYEGAVNPDGPPNFVAVVKKKRKARKKRTKRTGDDPAPGESPI